MDNLGKKKEWFEEWFDSPFYHKLYKHRDYNEANKFIYKLIHFLAPQPSNIFLDAACGKGRHAIYIESLGYRVDAFDLSPESIQEAKKNETYKLKFFINDIRNPLKENHYDYVLNLFTSFGYFDTPEENLSALKALASSLNQNGKLVLDFMNTSKVVNNLKAIDSVMIDDTLFSIKRNIENGSIVKEISFEDNGKQFNYQEKVKAITHEEFKKMFALANLKIENTFGDYELSNFDKNNSDRLILIASKNG